MSILESERLILRPPRPTDIQAMTVWLGDFSVSRNLAKVPHPYSEGDAEEFVNRNARHGDGHHNFVIARKADGIFLGGIGLNLGDTGYEFGYWLGKPFWGQGFASEAARGLVKFAFDRLDAPTVWAGWFHDNPASGNVLMKLGARHNGSRMRDCLARGHKVLCHEMLLTREAFLLKKAA
ncbi:MAG TPA: GNAT family N-acetyltransferase [Rhizomicrobium sp.]|jgi:RimJ/RimL family protein N-acetyltransferase|nr:GNAT family N-acetyltransferase [Rhizomicrobium sp.]